MLSKEERIKEGRIKGGKAAAKAVKEKYLKEYLNNPNYCLYCGKVILPRKNDKLKDVKIKKFCDRSCANRARPIKPKKIKELKGRPDAAILNRTKGELFSSLSNWQSARSCIRKSADKIYSKYYPERKCIICGYDKYVEVCHKKPVSKFPDTALIKEINDIDNLVGLCRNHHWEFDKKLIKL